METTTIGISVENWQWLNSLKQPGDSFNDVLDRLRRGGVEGALPVEVFDDLQGVEGLPDSLDLPGSGHTLDRRRAAIARLYAFLEREGQARKSEFLELIDPDDVGYSSPESFWANCVKGRDSLRSLPGVEAPDEGSRVWRFTD